MGSNYRRLASKQDTQVAKETGFEIQRNSGACKGRKGDLYSEKILIETKTCEKVQKSFKLEKAWFTKLRDQTFTMGKELGILVFSFGDRDQYGSLPLGELMNLLQRVDQLELRIKELEEEKE